MKIFLEILGFVIGLIIVCILIDNFFGIHIGLADLFQRFISETKDLFAMRQICS